MPVVEPKPAKPVSHWWRLGAAVLAGLIVFWLSAVLLRPTAVTALIGWDAAAAVYLIGAGLLFLTNAEPLVRARARQEDESRALLMVLVFGSIAASIAGIVLAFRDAQSSGKSALPGWLVGLAAVTLVLGWLVVQAVFTLHYAHRYFADRDADGQLDGGIEFPGEKPTSYRDFLYVAVCVGATCQVSDFDISTSRLRNLVTVHALIAFGFNTMVLALGINMIAGLVGHT